MYHINISTICVILHSEKHIYELTFCPGGQGDGGGLKVRWLPSERPLQLTKLTLTKQVFFAPKPYQTLHTTN